LELLTVQQLKKMLLSRGLNNDGVKSDLIKKLKHPEKVPAIVEKEAEITKAQIKEIAALLEEKGLPATFNGLLQFIKK